MENHDSASALSDLTQVQSSMQLLSKPVRGEAAYHFLLGLATGVAVFAQGFEPMGPIFGSLTLLISLALLITWWKKTHRWWVSGLGPTKARWWAVALIPLLAIAYLTSLVAQDPWVSLATGLSAMIATTAAGHQWMRVWRKELAEGAQ